MSKQDPGSNYVIANVLSDVDADADTIYTTAVDHLNALCVSFLFTVLTAATTMTATVQWSNNGTDYTDQTADGSGNDVSKTKNAATGSVQLDVPNPLGRYSRLKIVSTGDNAIFSCVAVSGPVLYKEPAATTV